jgi:hypothetical protein
MWRAYGGAASGVAMVLNRDVFAIESTTLNVYSSPVAYLDENEFHQSILEIIKGISSSTEFIKQFQREKILELIFQTFIFGATCSKHPGFKEEREWRVLHFPKLHPSTTLSHSIETIKGAPQEIYKIPLNDKPEKGLVGLEIPRLLNKIIIGPSKYPAPTYNAFVSILKQSGIQDATNRVIVSNIPLRI